MKLNVRCCCTPKKVMGVLDVPDALVRWMGGDMTLLRPMYGLAHLGRITDAEQVYSPITRAHIELRFYFHENGRKELAVYSDDRPVDFWRNLPGFEEDRAV